MTQPFPHPPLVGLIPHGVSSGTHLRSVKILLATGDAILPGLTVTPVDDKNVDLVGDVQITELTFGFSVATERGDIWNVNFKPLGGKKTEGNTALRIRYTTTSQPDQPQEDLIVWLPMTF